MYLLYSLCLSLLFLALLPYFIFQAIRHGKYASSFKQRLGLLPESIGADNRPTIWIHAVSVGEFLAARPLIERIRRDFPDHRVVVSTTTLTGQNLARSQPSSLLDEVFYFPFDWRFSVRRALARLRPRIVIILETELWPNFLSECRKRGIITIIANGRLAERSFSRYRRVRRFIARVLKEVSLLVMQSEADAERARLLGAQASKVRVCGNLKYDVTAALEKPGLDELDRQFALSATEHLIVAGSTAPGEEEILLDALGEVRRNNNLQGARLIIAPRHPERFNEVASLVEKSHFSFIRRSEAATGFIKTSGGATEAADVILLDSIGELSGLYKFASVVFVGGSLVARGGHNIIEPAVFAKPIIVGPHTENFRQIVSDFAQANAVAQVKASDDLSTAFTHELIHLLSHREEARAMGARALDILNKNRGATDCAMEMIKEVLSTEGG